MTEDSNILSLEEISMTELQVGLCFMLELKLAEHQKVMRAYECLDVALDDKRVERIVPYRQRELRLLESYFFEVHYKGGGR
jgi:hypothetical protein